MYQYIAKRLLLVIPTLFGAAVLVFLLLRLIPGDICDMRLAGEGGLVDEETLNTCRIAMGINKSLWLQFFDFIWGFIRFDLGTSMWTGQPISYEIGLRSCQLIVFESPDPDLARLLRVVHLESLTGFSRSRSIALVSCGSSPFSH